MENKLWQSVWGSSIECNDFVQVIVMFADTDLFLLALLPLTCLPKSPLTAEPLYILLSLLLSSFNLPLPEIPFFFHIISPKHPASEIVYLLGSLCP